MVSMHLYTYGVKVLERFKPKWLIAENVGGLRNSNEGESFKKILHDLETAGYILTPHLYKFEQYGILLMSQNHHCWYQKRSKSYFQSTVTNAIC